jgi:uncharacterized protein (TIGR02452 family)
LAATNTASAASSVTYKPTYNFPVPDAGSLPGVIEITRETTVGALQRLITRGETQSVALNVANPVEPGGGLLRGAIAQEEAICRCATLYNLLLLQPEMYEEVEANDELYTDYMSVIPNGPIFRDDQYDFIEQPFVASFITCAAPVAFRYFRISDDKERLHNVLEVRIRKIILCAIAHKFTSIILGAFGCGAFGNSSEDVAALFKKVLIEEGLRLHFQTIVFAIYSRESDKEAIFREGLLTEGAEAQAAAE